MTPTDLRFDPSRLTALADKARKAGATRAGLNDLLHSLRDRKRDLSSQIGAVNQRAAAAGPMYQAGAEVEAKRLQRDLTDLSQEMAVHEVEVDEAAVAAASARANLASALEFAKAENLAIPSALMEQK